MTFLEFAGIFGGGYLFGVSGQLFLEKYFPEIAQGAPWFVFSLIGAVVLIVLR